MHQGDRVFTSAEEKRRPFKLPGHFPQNMYRLGLELVQVVRVIIISIVHILKCYKVRVRKVPLIISKFAAQILPVNPSVGRIENGMRSSRIPLHSPPEPWIYICLLLHRSEEHTSELQY